MTWEQILTLLHIAQVTNDYPTLHNLRNKALDTLAAADLDALGFAGHEEVEE